MHHQQSLTMTTPSTRSIHFSRRRIVFFTLAAASSLILCVLPTYQNLSALLRQNGRSLSSSSTSFMDHGMPVLQKHQQGYYRNKYGATPSTPPPPQQQQPFHVLFSLLGRSDAPKTADALYRTWQVALKSVLLNAPTGNNRPLHIHVLCNSHAQQAVDGILKDHHLVNSKWRQPVKVQTYNVEHLHEHWRAFLQCHLDSTQLDERVSLGGYYRLLAHQVLNLKRHEVVHVEEVYDGNATTATSKMAKQSASMQQQPYSKINSILYMDSDVVILSNLNDLIPYIQTDHDNTTANDEYNKNSNSTIIFQGSKSWFCSGFVLLNLPAFDTHFWRLLDSIPPPSVGDQAVMAWLMQHYPNHTADLPPQWQRNLAHGWRHRPHKLLDVAGMVHFQGGTSRKPQETYFDSDKNSWLTQYCERAPRCKKNLPQNLATVEQTWGLASYYINMPWQWALYFGQSMIESSDNGKGYPLQYEAWTAVLGDEHGGGDGDYESRKLVPTTTRMLGKTTR